MDSPPLYEKRTLELVYAELDRLQLIALLCDPSDATPGEELAYRCRDFRRKAIETAHFLLSVAEAPDEPEATLPILDLADTPTAILNGNAHHERAMQAAFARE